MSESERPRPGIAFSGERCLHSLRPGVCCEFCVQYCPEAAIRTVGQLIRLDEANCNNCGACLAHCPVEAFTDLGWNEQKCVSRLLASPRPSVEIFCGEHPKPYGSATDSETLPVQIPGCLGRLSRVAFFQLGAVKQIVLRLDACANCRNRRALKAMARNLDVAQDLLESCGVEPNFDLRSQNQGHCGEELKAVLVNGRATSRRDLFLSIFKRTQEIHANALAEEPDQTAGAVKLSLLKNLSQLKESYTALYLERGSQGAAHWPKIRITETCTNCAACAHICPTGALRVTSQEREGSFLFSAGICLDCRLCEMFCPASSILRERTLQKNPFMETEVFSFTGEKCARCQALTRNAVNGLCHWCASLPAVSDLLAAAREKLSKRV